MRPSVPLILAALLSAGMLAGCGLKDDLYLPADPVPQPDQEEQRDDGQNSGT
ncbi:MAG: LPS translocon maturation chaperone LptM [Wenzhouxiangella sp.]